MSDPFATAPRILHVDDDPGMLTNVADYLHGEEISGWGTPVVKGVEVFDDAMELLDERRFDMVILDVRLGDHEPSQLSVADEAGVATLEQIRQRRFVPVVFWTGLPAVVADLAGPMVRVHEKTAGLATLLDAVQSLFATRLPLVNRALLRLIEEEQRRYMWDFVSAHWTQLSATKDQAGLAYLLAHRLGRSLGGSGLRQLAVDLGDTSGLFPAKDTIHPVEMYVQPPLPDTDLHAGDLLRETADNSTSWSLVMTPSCDLEWKKAERVLLATGTALEDHPRIIAWRSVDGTAKEKKKARADAFELLRQATGGQLDRWLYLPAAINVPDLLIDMQQLRTIPVAEALQFERVASLDSPFAESAINRFNRYFGRIGTPDLDSEAIAKRLEDENEGSPGVS